MSKLLRNRYFLLFVASCVVAMAVLAGDGRPLGELIGAMLILGLFMPVVAFASTARLPLPVAPVPWRRGEGVLLLGLLGWILVFLLVKGSLLAALLPPAPDPRLEESVDALLKLGAFVLLPWIVLRRHGYTRAHGGRPTAAASRLSVPFLAVALAGLAVQALLGSQFKRLLSEGYPDLQLLVGGAACLAWMSVEAGLVEEFFFRWYLQSRLAAWTRSEISGLFLGALVFGLAHAPGILLRGAGSLEGLGEAPALVTTLAYVVVTQGVAGLAFGVLWSRTRSLVLVVLLHGFFDALSGTASFIDIWWP